MLNRIATKVEPRIAAEFYCLGSAAVTWEARSLKPELRIPAPKNGLYFVVQDLRCSRPWSGSAAARLPTAPFSSSLVYYEPAAHDLVAEVHISRFTPQGVKLRFLQIDRQHSLELAEYPLPRCMDKRRASLLKCDPRLYLNWQSWQHHADTRQTSRQAE